LVLSGLLVTSGNRCPRSKTCDGCIDKNGPKEDGTCWWTYQSNIYYGKCVKSNAAYSDSGIYPDVRDNLEKVFRKKMKRWDYDSNMGVTIVQPGGHCKNTVNLIASNWKFPSSDDEFSSQLSELANIPISIDDRSIGKDPMKVGEVFKLDDGNTKALLSLLFPAVYKDLDYVLFSNVLSSCQVDFNYINLLQVGTNGLSIRIERTFVAFDIEFRFALDLELNDLSTITKKILKSASIVPIYFHVGDRRRADSKQSGFLDFIIRGDHSVDRAGCDKSQLTAIIIDGKPKKIYKCTDIGGGTSTKELLNTVLS